MKKVRNIIITILILLLSFYYTNNIVNNMKNNDILMKQIKEESKKYTIEPTNAYIEDNIIIPGVKGQEIDLDKSYNKMKKYGTYSETLIVMKEIKPTISIEDEYDKYITSGNKSKKSISLVFKLEKNTNINNILKILEKTNTQATFFIDGKYLENNLNTISNLNDYEIEILSYNNEYNKSLFKTTITYLESLSNEKIKYCYTEKENKKLLDICRKEKLHTIKPKIIIKNNLYKNIKNNLSNSNIYSLEVNNYIENELSITIDYIRRKGYSIENISNLLKE